MLTLQDRMTEVFPPPQPRGLQSEIASLCEVKPASVSAWFNLPEKVSSISRTNAEKLCNRFNLKVSPAWLAEGVGNKYQPSEPRPANGTTNLTGESGQNNAVGNNNQLKNRPDELVIPHFDTGGSMGTGLLLRDQPGVIQSWSVSQEWVQKNVKSHTGAANLCIVTGFGDSMKGMYNSGDPLVVDKGVKSVEYDAVYFFRVGEEGFIKRLQRIPGEGLRVLSENKQYDSWHIKPDMDFEVLGRVVKAWQGEDF